MYRERERDLVYVPQVRQRQGETFGLWEHPRRSLGSVASLLHVAHVALRLAWPGCPRRRLVQLWPTPFPLSLSLRQFFLWKQREIERADHWFANLVLEVGSWKYLYMYKRREWIWCCCKFQKWLIKELIHGNGIVAVNFFHELWFVGFRTKFMCT